MDLLSFPSEILLQIFEQNVLEVHDLFNLMITCKNFSMLIRHSNELWRQKFYSRWPRLVSFIQCPQGLSWQSMVLLRIKTGLRVRKQLKELSPRCYADIEPPVNIMDNMMAPERSAIGNNLSDDIFAHFVEDELADIIFHQKQEQHLTMRYYARKVLRYVRTVRLDKKWNEFLRRAVQNQSLVEGALLVSQWGQMDLENPPQLQDVTKPIENIIKEVKQKLQVQHAYSYSENHHPDPKQARKILMCINQVIYDELGFQGNIENYHTFENSYIDQVLRTKKGIPITLCIIYHEVAKRLGVECEPVSFPQHFLLRWKASPENFGADQFTYIDAFNAGSSHLSHSCPALIGQSRAEIRHDAYSAVSPSQVFERMVNNLIQCSRLLMNNGRGDNSGLLFQLHFMRLACAVYRRQSQFTVGYAELCVYLGTQLEEAIDLLQSAGIEASDHEEAAPAHWSRVRQITSMKCANKLSYQKAQLMNRQAVHRSSPVKYAVGLIMRHIRYGYSCVIVFWDPTCKATEEWVERMGVRNLERGVDQPFYHVLVDDGSYRYAAEENLELHPDGCMINHPDIGIHFEKYERGYYVPNVEKTTHYPEDEEIARGLLSLHNK